MRSGIITVVVTAAPLLTIDDVHAAARRLSDRIHRTPVITSQAFDDASGSQVVHSRRAPVIAHKVVPPFKGVHVYQGRTPRR